jgi:hypothetical protein
MSFYTFNLEKLVIKHKRGNITDQDVVTFSVFVNQVDRGHGSGTFVVESNTEASTYDITEDGLVAYPTRNRFNMSDRWVIGPLDIDPTDIVDVVYTGTNTSDSNLSSLPHQEQDELELKIVNFVAKKFVEIVAGAEFGSDVASALSAAFDKAFKDPVGDLIGYERQGPCNGPVFSGVVSFTGSGLDNLPMAPLTRTLYPGTQYPKTYTSSNPGKSFSNTYTDEATHDTEICGHIAETDVWFEVFRVPFISVRRSVTYRFPSHYPGEGLRQYGQPGATVSIKSLLGLRP